MMSSRFELETRRRAIGIGHALRCLAGVRRDRDRPDDPQHAEVEIGKARAGLVAHPADARVHPFRPRVGKGLAVLSQIDPDDVPFPGGKSKRPVRASRPR